jgi:non-ribosomal peptide synthetase component F
MKREELTSSSAFFSMYYLFLSQLTGQDDIVVGVASAGRMQQELENVAGMFVKTLPVRYRLDTKACFDRVVSDLHKYLIQAFSNQAYDLNDIMHELNNNKAVKIERLFNAGFVFLNFNDETGAEQTEEFVTYRFVNNGAKNAITLYVMEKPGSFYMRLEYSHAYFTKEDVELLIMQFKSLVSMIAGNIHAPVGAIISGNRPAAVAAGDDISFNF